MTKAPLKNAAKGKCPNCGKPAETATRPFCSLRCQQLDLGRWLKGSYVIPGVDGDAAGEEDL